MVKFVASVAVNTQKLSELSLLSHFTDMNLVNRSHTTLNAIDQDAGVSFRMEGTGLLYKGKTPYAGVIQSIDVYISGLHYELSGLDVLVKSMDSYFSLNFPALSQKIFSGNDTLKGSGERDVLFSYKGKDKVNGQGGNDVINGGKGADNIKGGAGDDNISGSGGADQLFGNNGNDTIAGGAGADTINGGAGHDVLTGNAGFNTFVFNTALSAATNVDTITDMTAGGDAIDLALSVFSALSSKGVLMAKEFTTGSHATDADQRIVHDKGTGAIYYDADGNGGGAQVHFATVSRGLSLSNTDFFVV